MTGDSRPGEGAAAGGKRAAGYERPAGDERAAYAERGTDAERAPGAELTGGPEDAPVLHLPAALLVELARAVEAAYPREGCGVLLGRVQNGVRLVTRQVEVENRWSERDDRYLLDPGTLRRLLEEEEWGGPRILGFYHSHPDAAAAPSETDREHAWPWYHYVIVPVERGRAGAPRAWELDPAADRFRERTIRGAD